MVEYYKRRPNTQCVICGTAIYRRPVELKRSFGRAFCSKACYGIACRKENPCIVCGKPILGGLNKKTCSRSCANIHRKGVVYKVGAPKDRAKSVRAIKAKLIKIRGGKCERCDYDVLEVLHIHHKNRNRRDNSFENLELICPNCHFEEHYRSKGISVTVMHGGVA